MNWRKWKIGLLVAMLTGALGGMLGLAVGIAWKAFWILLIKDIAKDTLLYIKSNPINTITFDTYRYTKDAVSGTTTEQSSKTTIPVNPEVQETKTK